MNKKIRKASKNDNLCNNPDKLINKPSLFFSSSLAMFRDCKSGGYNLEGSQANAQRLTNLILLIADSLRLARSVRLHCELFSRIKN